MGLRSSIKHGHLYFGLIRSDWDYLCQRRGSSKGKYLTFGGSTKRGVFFPWTQGHVLENARLPHPLCQAEIGFALVSSLSEYMPLGPGDPFTLIFVDFRAFL